MSQERDVDGRESGMPTGSIDAGGTDGPQSTESTAPTASDDRASGATTPREEAALNRVRNLSQLLDEAITVPGTNFRVGLDPILGILPVGGDAVATIFALYPVFEAYRFGAPRGTLAKMLAIVAIDSLVGSVPVLGTVFDAFWKANEWNARTLERHITRE